MNFINSDSVDVNGTFLQGYVETTFAKLVKAFGAPTYGPDEASGDGKVSCEWCLTFEDGTVATIYDYKEDSTPMGEYSWHIGGTSIESVNRVLECV
jgi:hypothetical protein